MGRTLMTLSVIFNDEEILLGMKKRGFGSGFYNGFGGKLEEGETLEEGMARELKEEVGLVANKMEEMAVFNFTFENKPGNILEVHVFRILDYDGEPEESDEIKPERFPLDSIPYEQMWPDDIYWLPRVLKGEKLVGAFHFNEDGSIARHELSGKSI